ncbi:NUDIX domain-containing protein [Maribellus comscasis]|uniref:NUDIX domain-containing protein n=1 Tax=Maribellus comscasis TaxID=2681766 RepID=A0A6I6JQ28_9BACT|nr:CoA pyrophosphatase [Maribellus comscasis]QGY45075.1 NUDIX domain-containing protein [Maribellus comscasis]
MAFQNEIKKALQITLPGEASHKKMLPPSRKLLAAPEKRHKLKHSSVLLALYVENSNLYGCLIKRPKHMKHHAGQIALPGGRIEKGENAVETALRETYEEIGVHKNQIEILGVLSELYVEVSGFLIQPIVGWLNKKPTFSINKDEVEKMVLFPILKYKNHFEKTSIKTNIGVLEVPCIKFDGEIIWGATAMILSEFYDLMGDLSFIQE